MEYIGIHKSPDRELIDAVIRMRGWILDEKDIERFKEDASAVSSRVPVYGVADGVTLYVEEGQRYPVPSGATDAARIFCEQAIISAEKAYQDFAQKDIANVFLSANDAIGKYNAE
jgi:hypothetical protein